MVDLYFPIILLHIMPLVVQILSWDTRHLVASNPLVVINTTTTIMMATMMRKMIWLIMQWTDIPIIHRRHPIHINNNSNRITTEPKWFDENGIPDKKTDHLVAQRRIVLRVQKLRFFLNSLSNKALPPFPLTVPNKDATFSSFQIKMQVKIVFQLHIEW